MSRPRRSARISTAIVSAVSACLLVFAAMGSSVAVPTRPGIRRCIARARRRSARIRFAVSRNGGRALARRCARRSAPLRSGCRAGATGPRTSPRPTSSTPRGAPGRRSRSSMRSTTRTPRRTWRPTAAPGACRPAPLRTGASARSTSAGGRRRRTGIPAGGSRSRWTCRRSRRRARTATSCWWRPTRRGSRYREVREHGGPPRRRCRLQLLRRRRVQRHPGSRRVVLHPSGRGAGGVLGRLRLRPGLVPGLVDAHDRGRRHQADEAKLGVWHESAWWGSGSGCSAWIDKPAWQLDTHCPMRTVADCPRWPTRTRGSRCTTPTASAVQRVDRGRRDQPVRAVDRRDDRAGRQRRTARIAPATSTRIGPVWTTWSAAPTASAAATTSAGRRRATTHRPGSAPPAAPRRCSLLSRAGARRPDRTAPRRGSGPQSADPRRTP